MKYSKSTLSKLNAITDKRPKTVIQHILKNGSVTTEELKELYGTNMRPEQPAMFANVE